MRSRSSLRSELLLNLTFLAAAAVLLALWTSRILERSGLPITAVVVLVGIAVIAFVLVGNYVIEGRVLQPLASIVRSAESIAAGDYERRVAEDGPREIASLARALNQLTDELLENQERLADNIRSLDETNRRLTQAHNELVQAEKMASLGQLAAGVAHEIGNPLGAVLGYVSLQKRRGGDPEILYGMEREVRRIDRIVRDLLDYARPPSAAPEPIDLNTSIRRVVDLLREQGWLSAVSVELDLGEDLPPVLGDPHRIDQIFVNLFRNAESAMGEKGGRISVETRVEVDDWIRHIPVRRANDPPGVNYSHLRRIGARAGGSAATLPADRDLVRITVSDSGPGIPEEIIGSIFDPFFTTKGPGEGTGLGLAIVAGTVAEMGGRVEAFSPPDGGATFSLWLPAAIATS